MDEQSTCPAPMQWTDGTCSSQRRKERNELSERTKRIVQAHVRENERFSLLRPHAYQLSAGASSRQGAALCVGRLELTGLRV